MQGYPNRCQHLKINGTQCGSPALRRNRFCFFHKRFQDERIKLGTDRARRGVASFVLPVLEDANSIQIALMQVMRLLVARQIDHKTASLLLYALQTASTNLRMTKFDPWPHDVVLDPRAVGDTPLDSHIWDDEDFEEEQDEEEEQVDEAVAALEAARKKKERQAAMQRWADEEANRMAREHQLQRKEQKPEATAKVTATGSAVVSPASGEKRPAAKETLEDIAGRIREKVRNSLQESGLLAPTAPGK